MMYCRQKLWIEVVQQTYLRKGRGFQVIRAHARRLMHLYDKNQVVTTFVNDAIKSVRKNADTTCFVCARLMYRNGFRQTNLTTATVAAIPAIAKNFLKHKENVSLCHRCYNSNTKGRTFHHKRGGILWSLTLFP